MQRRSGNSRTARLTARYLLIACAVNAALLGAVVTPGSADARVGAARASMGSRAFTLYSQATKKQFVNNTDDLARGQGHNPFGNYSGTTITVRASEKTYGPFPGDEGEFAFTLYANANHKTSAGSVIFICQYDFDKNALCDAAFQLKGGSLIGKGAFNFEAKQFSLSIIGGTYKYRGVKGVVAVSALGVGTQLQPVFRATPMLQAQRLSFVIHSA